MDGVTLLPADRYVVINKTILTDADRKYLISFYEPIIGHLAISLYLILINDLEESKGVSRDFTHHHLMSLLKTPLKILKEAREALEATGLLKTYFKKGDVNNYIYEIYSPLSPSEFFNHPILNIVLYNNIGATEYEYLKKQYPRFYFVSSTTKVLTKFEQLVDELKKDDFLYVVPDFRLNKVQQLENLLQKDKDKVEFLCNECCFIGCLERKKCYETVSRQNLGEDCLDHVCKAMNSHEGYRFSKAMQNSSFISVEDIQNNYLPKGFSQFKIEGRSLGSALVLEFLLYYMVKPEYQIHVREAIYLDNMLDLF